MLEESGIIERMLVMTVTEAAEHLKCSTRRVFQLIANGTLETAPRYGRETTVFKASVERALLNPPKPGRRKRRDIKRTGEIPVSRRGDLVI
jgi:excisionase family DNA binding protein